MRILLAAIIVLIGMPGAAYPDNWPQWRGASGNGVSSETGLPTQWSKDDIAWKAPLKGLGVSSPIVNMEGKMSSVLGRSLPAPRGSEEGWDLPRQAPTALQKHPTGASRDVATLGIPRRYPHFLPYFAM